MNHDISASPTKLASAPQIALSWLVRLRFGAVIAQLGALAAATQLMDVNAPVWGVLGLCVLTALTNLALARWLAAGAVPSERGILLVLCFDVVILTTMLLATGGPNNPFSVFYLVHVALAALLLRNTFVWSLVALSSLGFGSLFFLPVAAGTGHVHGSHDPTSLLHLRGMWVAYTFAAGFVGYFISKLAQSLREREHQVAILQRDAARTQRLVSLTTLAAGAAHELGSPLGTIAVASRELERSLSNHSTLGSLVEDAQLIRREVDRCRGILRQMGSHVGDVAGEMPTSVRLFGVVDDVRSAVADTSMLEVDCRGDAAFVTFPKSLTQTLANLVKNAIEAQLERQVAEPVMLRVRQDAEHIEFVVEDRGVGLSPEARLRIGEPFFTTKSVGRGLGLGVFLAHSFATKVGGSLSYGARDGGGTLASLHVPRDLIAAVSA